MKTECTEILHNLIKNLAEREPIDERSERHLASCVECRTAARELNAVSEGWTEERAEMSDPLVVETTIARARRETTLTFVRRYWLHAAFLFCLGVMLLGLEKLSSGKGSTHEGLFDMAFIALAGLTALTVSIIRRKRMAHSLFPYKRLYPGYQLSGVCLGLAETTGIHVTVLRLVFLTFLVIKPSLAFFVYLLLDLIMPLHPADRKFLMRHRLARLWRG